MRAVEELVDGEAEHEHVEFVRILARVEFGWHVATTADCICLCGVGDDVNDSGDSQVGYFGGVEAIDENIVGSNVSVDVIL